MLRLTKCSLPQIVVKKSRRSVFNTSRKMRGAAPMWLILIFLPVLSVMGCRNEPIAIRHRPELETPDRWAAPNVVDGAVMKQWGSSFQDPVLESLIAEGLEANYNLKAAAARLEAASAQATIAGADLLPSVSAGLNARGQRQNFIGFPIPGSEGKVLSSTSRTLGVSLDAAWEPDVWNRIKAGEAAAIADRAASEADFKAARLSLAAQISRAWYAALESGEQIRLAEQTVDNYKDTSERVRSRYLQGLQSSLDLRLALSSYHSAEALLEQRRQQMDLALRQLEILLGRYPSATIESAKRLPSVPPLPPAGIPAELVSRRPDLLAAEKRMLAAGARWTQSRRALYPSFSLTGSIGTSAEDFHQLFNGNFFMWNLAGNILQPVFNGGRLRAQIELADARSKEAAAQWASSVLQAFVEVESAMAAENFLVERERNIRLSAQQASASLELAVDRYQKGLERFVTVLEAQRRSLDAESQLLSIQRQRLDTRIDLCLSLGGDWSAESLKTENTY